MKKKRERKQRSPKYETRSRKRQSAFHFALQRCYSCSTCLLLKLGQDLTKIIYIVTFLCSHYCSTYNPNQFTVIYIFQTLEWFYNFDLFICISNFQNKPCAKTTSQRSP